MQWRSTKSGAARRAEGGAVIVEPLNDCRARLRLASITRRRITFALAAFTRITPQIGSLCADCDCQIQLWNGPRDRSGFWSTGKSPNSAMRRTYLSRTTTKSANTSASPQIKRTAPSKGLRIAASCSLTKRPQNKTAYTDYAPLLSDQSVGSE